MRHCLHISILHQIQHSTIVIIVIVIIVIVITIAKIFCNLNPWPAKSLVFTAFPSHITCCKDLSGLFENIFLLGEIFCRSFQFDCAAPFQLAASPRSLYRFHSLYFSAPIAPQKIVLGNCKGKFFQWHGCTL